MPNGKVILFYPTPVPNAKKSLPLNLLAISRVLDRNRYQVVMVNATVDSDFIEKITGNVRDGALCVGITAMTGFQIREGLKIARLVKSLSPDTPIIWGGYHPSILPVETLSDPSVDIVIKGQGESAFREVVEALANKLPLESIEGISFKKDGELKDNPPRKFQKLDEFPALPWDMIDSGRYTNFDPKWGRFLAYYSSQGCPFECGFCAETVFCRRQWVALSAERTVDEIASIVNKYGVQSILLRDSNFFVDKNRVLKICGLLTERGIRVIFFGVNARVDALLTYSDNEWELMRRAGFRELLIGAESGDQSVLDLIKKKNTVEDTFKLFQLASKHQFNLWVSLMIGLPGQDPKKEFDATISLLDRMFSSGASCVTDAYIFTYTPYPGSDLYGRAVKYGFKPPASLEEWSSMDLYAYKNPWLPRKYSRYASAVSLYILRRFFKKPDDFFLRKWFYALIDPVFRWRWKSRYFGFFIEKYIIDAVQFVMNILRKTPAVPRS